MFNRLTTGDDFNLRTPTNNASIELKKEKTLQRADKKIENICRNIECYHSKDLPKCHKTMDADYGYDDGKVQCWWLLQHNASQPINKADNKCGLKDLLVCPFCGGIVSEHPNKKYRDSYFVVYHDINCYMDNGWPPPCNFTLLPKNYLLKQWNSRIYHHF